MTNKIQASGKCGDIIVVIAGDTPAEFQDNAMAILGPDAMDSIGEAFKAALVAGAEMGVMTKAQDTVIAAGMAQSTPAQAAVTTPAVPATSSESSVKEETDKWGKKFTYGVPGAPSCPHGPRVKINAISKAGKPYEGWVCPTTTPYAFRNKIAKQDCAMEFAGR